MNEKPMSARDALLEIARQTQDAAPKPQGSGGAMESALFRIWQLAGAGLASLDESERRRKKRPKVGDSWRGIQQPETTYTIARHVDEDNFGVEMKSRAHCGYGTGYSEASLREMGWDSPIKPRPRAKCGACKKIGIEEVCDCGAIRIFPVPEPS